MLLFCSLASWAFQDLVELNIRLKISLILHPSLQDFLIFNVYPSELAYGKMITSDRITLGWGFSVPLRVAALLRLQERAPGMGFLFRWNLSLPNSLTWKLRAGNVISNLITFHLLPLKWTLKEVSEGQAFRSQLCLQVHKISKPVFSSQTQWILYFSQLCTISCIWSCASSPENGKANQWEMCLFKTLKKWGCT